MTGSGASPGSLWARYDKEVLSHKAFSVPTMQPLTGIAGMSLATDILTSQFLGIRSMDSSHGSLVCGNQLKQKLKS